MRRRAIVCRVVATIESAARLVIVVTVVVVVGMDWGRIQGARGRRLPS